MKIEDLKPWMRGPFELIRQSDGHLKAKGDTDHRISLIGFDNAIEVSIDVFIRLHPKSRNGVEIPKAEVEIATRNYHTKIEFLDNHVQTRQIPLSICWRMASPREGKLQWAPVQSENPQMEFLRWFIKLERELRKLSPAKGGNKISFSQMWHSVSEAQPELVGLNSLAAEVIQTRNSIVQGDVGSKGRLEASVDMDKGHHRPLHW